MELMRLVGMTSAAPVAVGLDVSVLDTDQTSFSAADSAHTAQ